MRSGTVNKYGILVLPGAGDKAEALTGDLLKGLVCFRAPSTYCRSTEQYSLLQL